MVNLSMKNDLNVKKDKRWDLGLAFVRDNPVLASSSFTTFYGEVHIE